MYYWVSMAPKPVQNKITKFFKVPVTSEEKLENEQCKARWHAKDLADHAADALELAAEKARREGQKRKVGRPRTAPILSPAQVPDGRGCKQRRSSIGSSSIAPAISDG